MKKILALMQAAVMLLSMAACGGSAQPAATEAPKPVATEAPAPAIPIEEAVEEIAALPASVSVDELLQSEETQSIAATDYEHCLDLMVELGFVELFTPILSSDMYHPGTLTYNKDAFKLEFEFKDWNSDRFYACTIYGAKTGAPANISGLVFNEFDHCYEFPVWAYTDKVKHLDVCPQYFEYHLANFGESGQAYPLSDWSLDEWDWGLYDENLLVSDFAKLMAVYSPGTGNMYNIVSTYTEPGNYNLGDYYNLFFWDPYELVQRVWENAEELEYFYFDINEVIEGCKTVFFEPGMTWKDWVDSKYNLDGWTFVDHGGYGEVLSPDNSYSVPVQYQADGGLDPLDMFLSETGNRTFISVKPST